jgi:hypothetical protein
MLFQNGKSKKEGRMEHMYEDVSMENRLSLEELKERFKEAKCFTSGVIFGAGDGYLGPAVWDEVSRHNKA